MAKKPTITEISSGYASNTQLNANFEALRNAFDNTLSRDGSAPNPMQADLDMNSNDILNVGDISVDRLRLNGVLVEGSALGGDGASFRYFSDRASAIAGTTGTENYLMVGDLTYVYDADGNALTTADGRTWSPASKSYITPRHWGAVGNGTTGDSPAFNQMLNWLSSDTNTAALASATRRVVDLEGRRYLLTNPLFIGEFDFNLDNTYELGYGPTYGVTFQNGRLIAFAGSPFPIRIDGEIGSYMVYVGKTVNGNYPTTTNVYEVNNIFFDNVEFDCNFTTGGIWIENSHRTHVKNCTFLDAGVGCDFIGTCIQSGVHPRGVTASNQETVIDRCRFEGNFRLDGTEDFPAGKDNFEGAGEIFLAQNPSVGAFTLNGGGVTAGEWIADDKPLYVEFKHEFAASGPFTDFSTATFTITGFADAARTEPLSETVRGPIGGPRPRWTYSENAYAVITSITSDTAIAANIVASTSMKNVGIRMQSHDFYISNNVFTALNYAMIIRGRAGQVYGNHPWSREIQVDVNALKVNFFGNYFDFTDVYLHSYRHQFVSNAWQIGDCGLILVSNLAGQDADQLVVSGNLFTEDSNIEFVVDRDVAGASWAAQNLATIVGNTFDVSNNFMQINGPSYIDGYASFGAGGQFAGNVDMGNNQITNMINPTANLHAANKQYVDGQFRTAGSADVGGIKYNGTTPAAGQFDGSATNPSLANTTRLNYSGNFNARVVNSVASMTCGTTMNVGGVLNVTSFADFAAGVTMHDALNMSSTKIISLADPTNAQDAATKNYVDTTSDYRLKDNVRPSTRYTDILSQLEVYDYEWKKTGETSTGMIAHELAEVLPEVVIGEKDGEEMQAVRYDRLVPYLVKALQESMERIEVLEAKLKD